MLPVLPFIMASYRGRGRILQIQATQETWNGGLTLVRHLGGLSSIAVTCAQAMDA
jgi:hypothetical protein